MNSWIVTTGQSCRICRTPGDLREYLFGAVLGENYPPTDERRKLEESFEDDEQWLPLEDSPGRVWSWALDDGDLVTVFAEVETWQYE